MTAVLTATLWGPMLVPPNDQYVAQSLIRTGEFSPEEFATWRRYLPEGSVVFDAGANIGAHTLAFASAIGMRGIVFAIEPQRVLYQMLNGSLALCGARNVVARNVALGREDGGYARIPMLDYAAPQNFGGLDLRAVPADAPCENIPIRSIDSFGLPRLEFLKIDCEGMELDILHGAKETITKCRPVISAEADREPNQPAMLAWFRLNGYRVWWHKPPLGALFPTNISINLLALPRERENLPEPQGHVTAAVE